MQNKDMLAMILAGGQGSRLGALTNQMAKPAVPFGSRYRIIDFPLSNCTNSGIDTVGVLTQYQPLALNTYVSNGHPWDLDRNNGGAFILPPYQQIEGTDWYTNTANAIYQNLGFIQSFNPKYVLILSGDHVYKMDYNKMMRHHIENEADVTIGVIEVPWEEASRFGIMNTDTDMKVTEFQEKPEEPESNLASMGIYIFTWEVLRDSLSEDAKDKDSSHDFGKNIIPKLLDEGMNLVAYTFEGYWKDVGTISSLWEANMDLLDTPEEIDLRDADWRIYSRNPVKPAHYISNTATIKNSCTTDGCRIMGEVDHSVLGHSVIVEEGAVVRDSVLMPGVIVRSGAVVDKAIIGMDSVISKDVRIGETAKPETETSPYMNEYCSDGISVVDNGITLKEGAQIPGDCMIEVLDNVSEADDVIASSKQVW